MKLNNIMAGSSLKTARKRVGRGIGSGLGKTCGKGHKGQKARTGFSRKFAFEGGQTSLYRRIPKSGFKANNDNLFTEEVALDALNKLSAGIVDLDRLKNEHIINKKTSQVRILATRPLSNRIHVVATAGNLYLTRGARTAIETAGGIIEEL